MSRTHRWLSVLVSLTLLTFLVDSTSAAAFKRVAKGDKAPLFALPDQDGNVVKLEDFKDNPLTIVTFWALWSGKSLPLLQDVQRLIDEFGSKGAKANVLAVNVEGADAEAGLEGKLKAFVAENHFTFPILLDKGLEQYDTWGVIATPSTAFLGKDLVVLYEFSGHPSTAYEDMRDEAMKILGLEEEMAKAHKPRRERYHPESKRVTLNYGIAKNLFERGQFSKAARKLKPALEEDPEYPEARALNGLLHLGMAQEGEEGAEGTAREEFQRAVELDETVPTGLAGLAHFALVDGDTPKALELARKAVQFTEPEELPVFETSEEEASAPAEPAGEQPAASETTKAAPAPAAAESGASDQDREAAATALLDEAAAAIEAGKADAAKEITTRVVDGLLGIPEKPGMKGKALEMMKMMKAE